MPIYAHGTRGKYAQGCQCNLCVLVHADPVKRGPARLSVPTGKVREHILALRAEGRSVRWIAETSGYSGQTIRNLADGKTQFTSRFIAEDVLSIPLEAAA